ncbi:MarR family winged helix-turn-helix transcriptional regulator [Streptosporangium roseum]|uniref:Transcriptional regulators-like protein n=1 Tax=Streptosporangium roseum (strain ATCC 12428 / DSM 43021 / JCM 3005 / KCTC 9067 / NCIMB 10171 / NRRL 2505 / NI 9100) TaxID=479432 RepID=D2BBC6_STRRD|nr:MarR family transcriptional regulator [Streptosporangium roseum]ACZ84149.1 Transcriptional regulators-like protein [Streptosporangium roseum DSM 43021]
MTEPMFEEGVRETGEDGGLNCLMAQTTRGHRVLLATLLGEIDLYPGQERVMTAIWENGPQSQNALARIVGIDVSTMTKSLQRLERSGFVRRSPCPTNRRVSIVDTTPEGDALRPRIDRVLSEVHARMTRGLTPEQTDQLCSLLEVVRGNICREAELAGSAGPIPPGSC